MQKIKISIIKTILLFPVLFLLWHLTSAQNVEIVGDTCEISMNGYKGGSIQWQFSNNNLNWKDINGANEQVLSYRISETGSFRAKVTDGKCSFFSETTSIEAFDFNILDENGKPRVSKKSEFIILIPDIQNYISNAGNDVYLEKIIDWILKFNNAGFKVKAVLQVGDVTNFNSRPEWEKAQKIFSKLDHKIDYILATGNHDYGDTGLTNTRNTYFSEYFNYKNSTSFVSSFEKNNFENTFFKINIHNQPFEILSLEFGPRDKIIAWADSIVKANPDIFKMLITHAYLNKNQERYNFAKYKFTQEVSPYAYVNLYPKTFGLEKANDGEDIWQKLIYPNNNFKFVFCGHKTAPDNTGYLISTDHNTERVLQMLYNTQSLPFGGEGWLQILEFFDDKKTVGIKTYSAFYNTWKTGELEQYNFGYN